MICCAPDQLGERDMPIERTQATSAIGYTRRARTGGRPTPRMNLNQSPKVLTCLIAVAGFSAQTASADAPGPGHGNLGTPTAQGALAAEQELARAIRQNDADGIARRLYETLIERK